MNSKKIFSTFITFTNYLRIIVSRICHIEKEGRLVFIYQSAYIYIHTHIFLHIIFLLSTASHRY
nr:MAG TPA: hypothetical protein [Caudoviricetes sp.]